MGGPEDRADRQVSDGRESGEVEGLEKDDAERSSQNRRRNLNKMQFSVFACFLVYGMYVS